MKKITLLFVCCLLLTAAAFCPASRAETEQAVDLDLSGMSGTIVYAQVYNMMVDPASYLEKTIRMSGYYSYFEDTEKKVVYHACVIPDATACCAQGIECVWEGEHAWPEEYPAAGTDITVTGRLEMYEEDGYNYLHLVNAELLWEDSGEGAP